MGNNNATANLAEDESSKSPLEPVSVENTQDHVFLAGEGKDGDGDIEKERLPNGIRSPETESQSNELVEDLKVERVEEENHQSGLESLVKETVVQLQKQKSVAKGDGTVLEVKEVEELLIGIESVESKLITTEFGNEEKPCVPDEIVFVSPRFHETFKTEEKNMINESLEEIVPEEDVVKVHQETGLAQITEFPEIKPEESLNLENSVVDVDEKVVNEVKPDQVISKHGSEETNEVQETTTLEVDKEEKDVESGRQASLKRMIRCRSLPVSHYSRAMGDSPIQHLVSEVACPSSNKMDLEKPNTSEALLVSCIGSNKAQETTEAITEASDPKSRERSDQSMEEMLLLSEDKSEIYEATIDVEEKTVMLNRSETEETRGIELSLGLSMKPSERSEEDDTLKESSGENLVEKKPSLGSNSMKGRVRKKSTSALLGTCLCCATAMN